MRRRRGQSVPKTEQSPGGSFKMISRLKSRMLPFFGRWSLLRPALTFVAYSASARNAKRMPAAGSVVAEMATSQLFVPREQPCVYTKPIPSRCLRDFTGVLLRRHDAMTYGADGFRKQTLRALLCPQKARHCELSIWPLASKKSWVAEVIPFIRSHGSQRTCMESTHRFVCPTTFTTSSDFEHLLPACTRSMHSAGSPTTSWPIGSSFLASTCRR